MADTGWVRDPDNDRWILLDHRGEELEDVTDALIAAAGAEVVARTLASDGFPPLPARPDLVCLLERGPHDGRFVFVALPGPPESMSFAQPALMVAGRRSPPGGWDRYVLAGQPCGHGTGCPYTYRWDPAP